MLNCRFRPISEWPTTPTPSYKQKAGSFKAKWSQTLDLLERELNNLRAKEVIIEGYFEFAQIRNDGWPKSIARPSRPGVVLSFETKRGRIVMPCDTFNHWESNLRAIALTLEHLRAVERYGVTTEQQEQYTGWLKLPASSSVDELTEHAKTLCEFAERNGDAMSRLLQDQVLFETIWKEAARKTHPDTGGNGLHFQLVMNSRDRIRTLKEWQ